MQRKDTKQRYLIWYLQNLYKEERKKVVAGWSIYKIQTLPLQHISMGLSIERAKKDEYIQREKEIDRRIQREKEFESQRNRES